MANDTAKRVRSSVVRGSEVFASRTSRKFDSNTFSCGACFSTIPIRIAQDASLSGCHLILSNFVSGLLRRICQSAERKVISE